MDGWMDGMGWEGGPKEGREQMLRKKKDSRDGEEVWCRPGGCHAPLAPRYWGGAKRTPLLRHVHRQRAAITVCDTAWRASLCGDRFFLSSTARELFFLRRTLSAVAELRLPSPPPLPSIFAFSLTPNSITREQSAPHTLQVFSVLATPRHGCVACPRTRRR